ncbi:MAG: glycoside hydrolase family 3 protein [Rhodobacteraceae bacterium]|nr:glycoside hydrolase family 3 protein [Paracoccaceae bacterium]
MTHYGAVLLDAEGYRLTPDEKALFREMDPFGFILFARNIDTPDQVRALCADFREAVGREALITVDQEGGRVQRLRAPHWREWTPALDFVLAAGAEAPRAMYLRNRLIAAELCDVGIDSNCAPLGDLATDATHPFLRNRCYGTDVETVVALARATAQAHLDGGVLPIVKHMPGHGRATVDSHAVPPRVDTDWETLRATDLAVFKALNDLPLGMTAHIEMTAVDDLPATLSAKTMQMIRDEIGFDGLIMTDDTGMKALAGTQGEIAAQAIAAGCDVVLCCNATLDDRRAAAEAAGRMSDVAQARADAALRLRKSPDDVDIAAITADHEALMSGTGHG